MGEEEELEEIKRKKIAQLQREQQSSVTEDAMKEQADQQRSAVMRQILTPEARERLARIKIAKPDFVEQVENQLIMLAQSGQLRGMVDDQTLVQILEKLTPKKREINIKRM
jgi:programmed cell death protein 5